MKISNLHIGNRTRDLPACSAVPQPTAPLRTSLTSTCLFACEQLHGLREADSCCVGEEILCVYGTRMLRPFKTFAAVQLRCSFFGDVAPRQWAIGFSDVSRQHFVSRQVLLGRRAPFSIDSAPLPRRNETCTCNVCRCLQRRR